jgi:hypothetical protein
MKKLIIIIFSVLIFPATVLASFSARLLSELNFYWYWPKCEQFITEINVNGIFYETTIAMKVRLANTYEWYWGSSVPKPGKYEFSWVFRFPNECVITECLVWDKNQGEYLSAQPIDLSTGEALYDPNSPNIPQLLLRSYRGRQWSGAWDIFYQLKVAPVNHDEVIEINIKYLTPCKMYWAVRRVEIQSRQLYDPSNRYYNSDRKPAEFRVYDYNNPDIPPENILNIAVTWQKQGQFWYAKIGPDDISFGSSCLLTVAKESPDGRFLQTYSDSVHQFYQLATLPHIEVSDIPPRHIIIGFDLVNEPSYYYQISRDVMLEQYYEPILYATTPFDSLAFVTSLFTVKWLDEKFVVQSPDLIHSRINQVKENVPKLNTLPFLLREAVQFLNDRDISGEIWVISNAKEHSSPAQTAMDIINQTYFKAKHTIKFRFIDAAFYNLPYVYINNLYYRGNEYLYENLTRLSRGSMLFLRNFDSYNWGDALMDCLTPVVSSVEIDPIPIQGLTFSRIPINWGRTNFNITSRYFEIGLFTGDPPFQIQYYGNLNDEIYSKKFTFQTNNEGYSEQVRSNVKTFWYAQYINDLLQPPQSFATIKYIEQLSVENHILSPYTGFVLPGPGGYIGFKRLSPDDTLRVEEPQQDQEQQTQLPHDYTLSAYPNPFNPMTNITIQAPESNENHDTQLFIINTLGQTIKTYHIENSRGIQKIKIEWNGLDESGQPVASGIYFVSLKTGDVMKSIKITLVR